MVAARLGCASAEVCRSRQLSPPSKLTNDEHWVDADHRTAHWQWNLRSAAMVAAMVAGSEGLAVFHMAGHGRGTHMTAVVKPMPLDSRS